MLQGFWSVQGAYQFNHEQTVDLKKCIDTHLTFSEYLKIIFISTPQSDAWKSSVPLENPKFIDIIVFSDFPCLNKIYNVNKNGLAEKLVI